MSVIQK